MDSELELLNYYLVSVTDTLSFIVRGAYLL